MEDSQTVLCWGEQLQRALCILQEVTKWSIAGQMAMINTSHLEEGEVSQQLHQVEDIMVVLERRALSPHSTHPAKLDLDNRGGCITP